MGDQSTFVENQANLVKYQHVFENEFYKPSYEIDYTDPAFTDFYGDDTGIEEDDGAYWDD